MEKTKEQLLPVTLVLQTAINAETQSSNPTPPPRNRIGKSLITRLKRARMERVKVSKNILLKMAEHEKKPGKQEATIPPAKGVVDHPPGPADLDHASLDRLGPLSIEPGDGPRRQPKTVEERKETIVEEHFSNRDSRKQSAPQPILRGAKYSYVPKPEYPEQARREGWEGTVLLAILVDAEGRPEKIVLSRSSGFGALDAAAQETVKHWRFQPAHYGRTRVQSWVKVPIVFTLAEAK
jgi:TonB family protein